MPITVSDCRKWKISSILGPRFQFGVKNGSPVSVNSLVTRRVSLVRKIVMLFWTKYVFFFLQIKPRILKLSIKRGQNNLSIVFILLAAKKKTIIACRFGRTARLWLPLVLRAQPPYARSNTLCKWSLTSPYVTLPYSYWLFHHISRARTPDYGMPHL